MVTNNMENKTAVGWLEEKINLYNFEIGMASMRKYIEYAKQMEKEQITKAYANGVVNEISIYNTITGEEFYNQTYGK